jgi:alpha-2-macroglobulin
MRFLGSLLIGLFCILSAPLAHAQDAPEQRPFVHKGVAKDAERYETYIKDNWKADVRSKSPDLRLIGDRLMSSDPRGASRNYAAAVASDSKSPEAWLGLARALLAIKADRRRAL